MLRPLGAGQGFSKLVPQSREIRSGGFLEDPQAKFGGGRDQVVEDVRLDAFILSPNRRFGEHVNFQGESLWAGGQLADQEGHFLFVNIIQVGDVGFDIRPESTHIGELAAVNWRVRCGPFLFVIGFDLFLFFLEIGADQFDPLEAFQHAFITELDARHINVQ